MSTVSDGSVPVRSEHGWTAAACAMAATLVPRDNMNPEYNPSLLQILVLSFPNDTASRRVVIAGI